MKFGLFIGLLVLLASTDVFGRQKTTVTVDSGETKDTDHGVDSVKADQEKSASAVVTSSKTEHQDLAKNDHRAAAKVTVEKEETKPVEKEETKPAEKEETKPAEKEETKIVEKEASKSAGKEERRGAKTTVVVSTDTGEEKNSGTHVETEEPKTVEKEVTKPAEKEAIKSAGKEERRGAKTTVVVSTDTSEEKNSGKHVETEEPKTVEKEEIKPAGKEEHRGKTTVVVSTDTSEEKNSGKHVETEEPKPVVPEVRPGTEEHRGKTTVVVNTDTSEEKNSKLHVAEASSVQSLLIPENHVRVSGNIVLVKYLPTFVDTVQYDLDGARLLNGGRTLKSTRPFAQDFLDRQSRITLYVATSKTTDIKLAFAKFPIQYENDHFPFLFNIDVELPSQQRGLLERADVTLYFFVYVHNLDKHVDTYLPAGTSQILLQGTNRLVQKLDVYVKASGIEINGLFRGRFGQQFIPSGTSFQIFIVPEYSLALRHSTTFESVAQLTINSVPAMFPVPYSLMVNYQSLKPNTKYYAIAFIFENGIQRPIHQEPIWVINEQNVLVTSQVVFNVIPSPFILRGVVSRSMPGTYFIQPGSSLILRLHEIGSDSQDIIYKMPEVLAFPQVFQINISQSSRFDASKRYDIRALLTDGKNEIYMASLQPIPLLDELTKLTVPVDDLLYYVQVRLQASSNQFLTYIPGSSAQVFVTESPETPVKPIVAIRIDSLASDFRDFSIQVPATAIQRGRNYYLVMMIEINGMITHVSKTLLISNNQPPPFAIQLPVLSLNLVSGVIYDKDNRPAQWTSSSSASVYLVDDHAENLSNNVVQVWKIHVENDFPIRFEVQLDFSRLRANHVYRLQAAIENGLSLIEYKPAGSVLTLNSNGGIITDLRVPVVNVKTFQRVKGLIYINDVRGPLPEKSEIIVQLSSSPSLTHPRIVEELRIKVEGRSLPIDFSMDLPLNKIDITSVYYFFVQYVVRDSVVIPVSQAFAFSPRNDVTVVLTLSKTPQIPITGQITSTGSPLMLPDGALFHIYITDNATNSKPFIYNEVFLRASPNSLYEFTMNIDSLLLQKQIALYLRADILYQDEVILSIPRPALLQITPGGEWNINLVVDLPTLLVGQIISMSQYEATGADFEVYIQIIERGTTHVVTTTQLRLEANFPQKFRIEVDNEIIAKYTFLQARAIIKNCKEQVLFEAGGFVDIHAGINVKVDLPVVLTNPQRMKELRVNVNQIASLYSGSWRLSVTGTETGVTNSLPVIKDVIEVKDAIEVKDDIPVKDVTPVKNTSPVKNTISITVDTDTKN
jgi:uncharacterized lipoprotein YbaY